MAYFVQFHCSPILGVVGKLNIQIDNFILTIIQNFNSCIILLFYFLKLLMKFVPKNNNYEIKGNIIFVYIVKLIYHYCITCLKNVFKNFYKIRKKNYFYILIIKYNTNY